MQQDDHPASDQSGTRRALGVIRADTWWEYKISPCLAVAYATCLEVGAAPQVFWSALLLVVSAPIPVAAFAAVLNDLTDREDDLAAGKQNRLAQAHALVPWSLLALCVGLGAAITPLFQTAAMKLFYWLGWLAFVLYSVPPARLKRRGLWGAVADTLGANTVASGMAVLVVSHAAGVPWRAGWMVPVCMWSFCWGMRGIIWHQLSDAAADRVAGVGTFVLNWGEARATHLVHRVLLPVELACLAIMLAVFTPLSFVLVFLYAWLEYMREKHLGIVPTVVTPGRNASILGLDFYVVFLPLGLLVASALQQAEMILPLLVHALLFRSAWMRCVRDALVILSPWLDRSLPPPALIAQAFGLGLSRCRHWCGILLRLVARPHAT